MPKEPNRIDRHVGSRVRMRRMMLNMTQTDLGNATGITFQQIQKYENGTNRISASRLMQLSLVLKVPISFFFESALGQNKPAAPLGSLSSDSISEFVASRDGLDLMRAFVKINSPALRRSIVRLMEEL